MDPFLVSESPLLYYRSVIPILILLTTHRTSILILLTSHTTSIFLLLTSLRSYDTRFLKTLTTSPFSFSGPEPGHIERALESMSCAVERRVIGRKVYLGWLHASELLVPGGVKWEGCSKGLRFLKGVSEDGNKTSNAAFVFLLFFKKKIRRSNFVSLKCFLSRLALLCRRSSSSIIRNRNKENPFQKGHFSLNFG